MYLWSFHLGKINRTCPFQPDRTAVQRCRCKCSTALYCEFSYFAYTWNSGIGLVGIYGQKCLPCVIFRYSVHLFRVGTGKWNFHIAGNRILSIRCRWIRLLRGKPVILIYIWFNGTGCIDFPILRTGNVRKHDLCLTVICSVHGTGINIPQIGTTTRNQNLCLWSRMIPHILSILIKGSAKDIYIAESAVAHNILKNKFMPICKNCIVQTIGKPQRNVFKCHIRIQDKSPLTVGKSISISIDGHAFIKNKRFRSLGI